MKTKMLNEKVALVTGASSGIGESISETLVRSGWIVIGVARSEINLEQVKNRLGNAFIPIVCDVSYKENIQTVSKSIQQKNLCPSLFFLNAGMAGEGVIEDPNRFDLDIYEKVMRVNYFGVLAWVEFWEKPCQESHGANFIVTSSVNAIFAPPLGGAYSASKAAIAKAFESLALTYYDKKLRFSVVYPGPVDTAGLKGKLPFTWSAERMGECIVDFALSSRSRCEPSWFYKIVSRILCVLPLKYTKKIFG